MMTLTYTNVFSIIKTLIFWFGGRPSELFWRDISVVVSLCLQLFELAKSRGWICRSSLVGWDSFAALYNANIAKHGAHWYFQCRRKEFEKILWQMPWTLCKISGKYHHFDSIHWVPLCPWVFEANNLLWFWKVWIQIFVTRIKWGECEERRVSEWSEVWCHLFWHI